MAEVLFIGGYICGTCQQLGFERVISSDRPMDTSVGLVHSFSSREPAFSLITFLSNDTGRMTG